MSKDVNQWKRDLQQAAENVGYIAKLDFLIQAATNERFNYELARSEVSELLTERYHMRVERRKLQNRIAELEANGADKIEAAAKFVANAASQLLGHVEAMSSEFETTRFYLLYPFMAILTDALKNFDDLYDIDADALEEAIDKFEEDEDDGAYDQTAEDIRQHNADVWRELGRGLE